MKSLDPTHQPTALPLWLALCAAAGLAQAASTDTGCSNAAPCLTPTLSQAEALFAGIETHYPTLFALPAQTQSLPIAAATAHVRSYANTPASGLATYQGSLWYSLGGNWTSYASLDQANVQFCASQCWNTTPAAAPFPVVDTAQSKSYNLSAEIAAPVAGQPFFGQDAQTFGAQPSYSLSSDGKTVLDQQTGLTWMRGPNTTLTAPLASDKKTWSQAQAWVASVNALRYGGYSDWRLPTLKEQYSLMNFQGTDPSSYQGSDTSVLTPFIDTRYFNFGYGQTSAGERIIDSQYASSNVFVVNPAETGSPKLFGVNLADGRIKGYDLTMPDGTEKTFFVQLVRGAGGYGIYQLGNNGDGSISDATTGLMWSRSDSGHAMTWPDALAWVQTQNAARYLGYSDWRLPNIKELHSLVNYANAPDFNGLPAIDTAFFDCTPITNENGDADYPYYWSSTTHAGYSSNGSAGSQAAYIAFGRALGWPSGPNGRWVDVHGAGAQRSDPKVGPPYSYATSHSVSKNGTSYSGYAFGPQGDAVRGLNFVRLVR